MKLSIEAKVAAAVAAAFAALSIGAIAQQQSEHGTGVVTGYSPTNDPGMSQITLQASKSSLSGHDGRAENQLLAQY